MREGGYTVLRQSGQSILSKQEPGWELGAALLAPGPCTSPPASRWGSRRCRQPHPAPKPRLLRPGRGHREGAGPRGASSTQLINLPAPGGPDTGFLQQHPRPAHCRSCRDPPTSGGNEGTVEGALLLRHYLEK
ncbi:hypothetical protein LEMLEM_LOCUS7236 [Lemmus lemmus]